MIKTALKMVAAVIGIALLFTAPSGHAAEVTAISGAGATFPYPVYSKWAAAYNRETGVRVNYQSIGSGGGIKQIKAKTVDFGASDAPLKPADLDKSGLLQFPMIMGGVVPVVNLAGVAPGAIRMNNRLLADIYLGKVRTWNDARVKAENPGLALPAKRITVVHRSDGSGTTWIFTNYLSKVSAEWKRKIGNNKAVAWPVGIGGKGNEGVASYVKRIKGSIGYVEYAYALQNHLTHVKLRNRDGGYVEPAAATFQAAAANADWAHAKGFYRVLTDQPGKNSWPITGASFILMYRRQMKPDTGRGVLKFFDWAYQNGAKMAEELDYVPMPAKVVRLVEATWHKVIRDPQGRPIWK
ncbi:MAG: phosphate ABC transporter substrate-binding protein PstS [Deltaproteobacteria bacterium]|nr:MAG: phosphate ABC transporter substrate-binding protein PstS [Deltaproteobacteria bacterium]